MPIVLQNNKAKGRFIKYTSIGGITKSVFVDAFSEYLVPEVDSTDALLNKVDRSRINKAAERQNEKTLNSFLFRKKIRGVKPVTDTARWQRKVVEINSDKQGFLMVKDGQKHAFSVNSLGDLAIIGRTIFNTSRTPTQLASRYNGDYKYAEDTITITNGLISHINGSAGADSYTLTNEIGTTVYTVYVADGVSLSQPSATIYQDEALTTVYNISATLKYDVPASDTNQKITFNSGIRQSSSNYAMESDTYYLSGSSGTSYTFYNEVGEDVYDLSDATYFYSDDQGFSPVSVSRTVFQTDPWKYITFTTGRITAAGNINAVGAAFDSYAWAQGRVNTTVYVVGGSSLQTGLNVYTDSGLSTALSNGDYTYNGNTYSITSGSITRIV
jgi:hypothetical protein